MSSARPLHELLADLTGDPEVARAHGDPEAYLAANGHADLPSDLVAEAVVSYADTAPVEVAEHLAPYVTTHSAVPSPEPPADDWFGLLATAPTEAADLDGGAEEETSWSGEPDPGPGLDFGTGSTDVLDEPSTPDTATSPDADVPAEPEAGPGSSWTDLEPELDPTSFPAALADEDADPADDLD